MSFPRYPKYKDSGVAWLGEVPEHWRVAKAGSFLRIQSGFAFPSTGFVESEGAVRLLRGVNVGVGGLRWDETVYWEREPGDGLTSFEVQVGDVVVGMDRPVVGAGVRVAMVGSDDVPCLLLQRVARVQPSSHLRAEFLFHLLSSPAFVAHFAPETTGVSVPHISPGQITSFTIPVPPIDEQSAIFRFLDHETAKIDALVAEQRRLVELLKEKRQAVISHAVTKGLNPDAPMKDSGVEWLGEVPVHWSVLVLKRIAAINTGVAKGKDLGDRETTLVPYLRVANVQDGYLDLQSVATIEIPVSDLPRYALKRGDVLMNEGGDFDKLGRGCVWDCQIEPCITQNHVFAVRPRDVHSAWISAITSSDYAQFYFMAMSKQSTNLASISSTNLMELPVVVPPATERLAVLAMLAEQTLDLDTLTAEAERAIALLQERRTALISAAVTGQIDVRAWAREAA